MAQHDYVIDNSTGANVRADINSALQAIVTNNSGSSAPSATFPFMLFADSSAGTMKIRNAADNAFIELFQLDGTFTLEDGSASTPALAFRDDLNTGIFQPGNNQLAVSCNGTEVVEFGTAEAVFNDTGANIDFRVESDNNTHMFFVDAGNDRVGIGLNTPSAALHIKSADNILAVFESTDADALIKFQDNSTSDVISMGALGGDNLLIRCDAGNIVFHVANNNEKVRIQNAGGISFNGDTAAANALDDYEEGQWTATLAPTSSQFTPTTNTNTCSYTKIGRLVTVVGIAKMTTPSSLGSYNNADINHAITVSGLPFTILNATNARSTAVIGVGGGIQFPDGVLASHGNANTTSFTVFVSRSNGGIRVSPTLTVSTDCNFHFQFSYFV